MILNSLDTILSGRKCGHTKYEMPKVRKTPFIVDDSYFQPLSEAVKNISNGSITATEKQIYYDFPNGRDDGSKVPINRRHDIHDITEISAAIVAEAEELAKKKESLLNQINVQKSIDSLVSKHKEQIDNPAPSGKSTD